MDDDGAARGYLQRTLDAARQVITDLSTPLGGDDVAPGDLVRENAADLPDTP